MTEASALPAQSYVYVIGDPSGPQKVGFAADPERRLALFRLGNASDLVVSCAVPVLRFHVRDVERYAHWLLREHRARGEWFSVSPAEARSAVEAAVAFVVGGNVVGYRGSHSDVMTVRFEAGDFGRIDAVAGPNQRAAYIRKATRDALKRDEAVAKRLQKGAGDDRKT